MLYLLVFALGFLANEVLEYFFPGAFLKFKVVVGSSIAAMAALWEWFPWNSVSSLPGVGG